MFSKQLPEDKYYSGISGIKLYPTEEQSLLLDMMIEGYKRVYNWALSIEQYQYSLFIQKLSSAHFLSFIDLQNMYPEFRKSDSLLMSLPTHSMINAISDLVRAYELFFKNKTYFNTPRYKAGTGLFSSYKPRSEVSSFYFNDNMVKVEGLKYGDTIATRYHSGYTSESKIKYVDPVIKRNNRTREYFLSFKLICDKIELQTPITEAIGVDVNKQCTYACSNGLMIYSRDTSRIQNHLKQFSIRTANDIKTPIDQLSNRAKDRLNRQKKLYEQIANIHKDTCYKGSLEIIRNHPEAVILETLDIKAIMSKHYIADDLMSNPLGVAQEILANQCFKYNIPVIYAPQGFESSNICSCCGSYKNIGANKFFICDNCGTRIDRDLNAAINLKLWYEN